MKAKSILIATSGAGGHLYPALRLAERLKDRGLHVCLSGHFGFAQDRIKNKGFRCVELNHCAWKGFGLKSLTSFIIGQGSAFYKSILLNRQLNPDMVVGFGGFSSVGPVLSGYLLGKKLLIHEQNVRPGKANLFLSHFVKHIALSFEQSRGFFKRNVTHLTGCPSLTVHDLPHQNKDAHAIFELDPAKKTILVMGGSQGSEAINQQFLKALSRLPKGMSFQIIHLAGIKNEIEIRNHYQSINMPSIVFGYLEDMVLAYRAADIVISRAGAVSLTEIMNFNKKAIIIPYPHAGGHQKDNASVLSSQNGVTILEEHALSPEVLANAIESLFPLAEPRYSLLPVDPVEALIQLIEKQLDAQS